MRLVLWAVDQWPMSWPRGLRDFLTGLVAGLLLCLLEMAVVLLTR
jgi:hypothetical protein